MARPDPAKLTVGKRFVAVGILAEALNAAQKEIPYEEQSPQTIAEWVIDHAWDTEYKPNAERLILILDASIEFNPRRGADPVQAALDDIVPMSAGDGTPDDLAASGAPCPNISNGESCRYYAGHDGPHTFGGGLKDPVSKKRCLIDSPHESHAWIDDSKAAHVTYACSGVPDAVA